MLSISRRRRRLAGATSGGRGGPWLDCILYGDSVMGPTGFVLKNEHAPSTRESMWEPNESASSEVV
jgi:hypothetical protein